MHIRHPALRILYFALFIAVLAFCCFSARYFPRAEGLRILTVPDLGGSLWKENAAGENFAVQIRQISDDAEPGTVLSTDPPGGSRRKIPAGTKLPLTVIVSGGREQILLPDLREKSCVEAARVLHGLGLSVRREERDAGEEKAGYVLTHTPEPGETVSPGDTVTLYVGKYGFGF